MERAAKLEHSDLGAAIELYQLQLNSLRRIYQSSDDSIKKKVNELIVFLEKHIVRLQSSVQPSGKSSSHTAMIDTESLIVDRTELNVSWDDIIGLDDVVKMIKVSIILPLRQASLQSMLTPGILLYGPPGTGKTLLAKIIAKECGYAFFNVSPSSILNMFQGESEQRINQLFATARSRAPSVLFFDEIDSIGGTRKADHSHSILNQLLINMDGVISSSEKIIVIGASNMPWMLDDALRRRLTLNMYIPLPKNMYKLLVYCLKKYSFECEDATKLQSFANELIGYSGSDVANLCRIANLLVSQSANRYRIRNDGFYESVPPCEQCQDDDWVNLVQSESMCIHCMSYKMDVMDVPKDKLILRKMNLDDLNAAKREIIINPVDTTRYESFGL